VAFRCRVFCCFFFFFSSRRRHTRCLSDWSSDVCSSDLDVGRLGDDHFIAAEYVDGITLRQRMQRGEVPLAEVMSIATQIASALEIGRASCRERVESAGGGVGVGTDNEGGGWTGQGWGTS